MSKDVSFKDRMVASDFPYDDKDDSQGLLNYQAQKRKRDLVGVSEKKEGRTLEEIRGGPRA